MKIDFSFHIGFVQSIRLRSKIISFFLQLSQFVFNMKIMQLKRMISLELESIYMQPIIQLLK